MSRNISCVLLVAAELLCFTAPACTPQLIVAPQVPAAVAPAATASPAAPVIYRIDPDRGPSAAGRGAKSPVGSTSALIDDASPVPAIDRDAARAAPPDGAARRPEAPAMAPAANRERASDAWAQRGTVDGDVAGSTVDGDVAGSTVDGDVAGRTIDSDVALTLVASSAPNSAARTAFNFFVAKGLAGAQAAGIVGNLIQESNVNPRSVQSGGPGRGIAQWSAGARWNNLLAFARAHHEAPLALATQLKFVWHELTTVSSFGLGALRAAHSVAAATNAFARSYEVCGACDEPRRIELAREVLRAFGTRAARPGS
jgi:hypothetical protein